MNEKTPSTEDLVTSATTTLNSRTMDRIERFGWKEVIAFSGGRNLSNADRAIINGVVDQLSRDAVFVTGGCIGVDAYIARLGYVRGNHIHTIIPGNQFFVDPDWRSYATSYLICPTGSDYRYRNELLVARSSRLVAFPTYQEADVRSRRSGAWMTIRIAQRTGHPTEIHVLRPGG